MFPLLTFKPFSFPFMLVLSFNPANFTNAFSVVSIAIPEAKIS